ncbi:pumilio domain member 4 [Perkinsus olseni]|uniref:Pumilio domain member 4 n=1 Tax=Perkinsus olseni TaxID=32597 RepID=A0A7J6MRU5_PEROL|nr:pumilio domain member 4 [Perkinsus olseni]
MRLPSEVGSLSRAPLLAVVYLSPSSVAKRPSILFNHSANIDTIMSHTIEIPSSIREIFAGTERSSDSSSGSPTQAAVEQFGPPGLQSPLSSMATDLSGLQASIWTPKASDRPVRAPGAAGSLTRTSGREQHDSGSTAPPGIMPGMASGSSFRVGGGAVGDGGPVFTSSSGSTVTAPSNNSGVASPFKEGLLLLERRLLVPSVQGVGLLVHLPPPVVGGAPLGADIQWPQQPHFRTSGPRFRVTMQCRLLPRLIAHLRAPSSTNNNNNNNNNNIIIFIHRMMDTIICVESCRRQCRRQMDLIYKTVD